MSTTIACLQGAHAVMAHWGGPHWLLNDEDARNYANAVNNVARHYDVAVAQKTIDVCNLIGLVCFYEGTRLFYSRTAAARQPANMAANAQQRGQVVPIFSFAPPAYPPAQGPPAPPAAEPYGPPNPVAPEGPVH